MMTMSSQTTAHEIGTVIARRTAPMTAAEYDTLAVKAAHLAETATTHADASYWWNRSDQWSALADRARTSQED